jgi:hypothetical protein
LLGKQRRRFTPLLSVSLILFLKRALNGNHVKIYCYA